MSAIVPFVLLVSAEDIKELWIRKTELRGRCEYILRKYRVVELQMDIEKKKFLDMINVYPPEYLRSDSGHGYVDRFNQWMKGLEDERKNWLEQLQDVNRELTSTVARLRDAGIME